jgi:hypothetical protein
MTDEDPRPPGLTPEQNDAKLTMEAAMMAYDVAHFEWNEGNDASIGPWKRMIQAHDVFDKAWKAYIVAIDGSRSISPRARRHGWRTTLGTRGTP